MSSKKEEERNEKVIRGLLKLPPNRRCINCNSLGPQYVCTNFWTFVCITCSGIHREFTHRVKSVSMAKFTSQEVDALQKGGNQRARESYLKDYDPMQQKFPDSRNVDKIREFIKSVYVDKKYAGAKNSERPPRDLQNDKKYVEEDHRRASSYHSYSQSPPYDFQYEDRINGTKQNAMLTRKPGSDRGRYEGKLASFLSCPINSQEFENRIPGSRVSDFLDSNVDNIRNRSFDSISIKSADSNNDTFDEPIMQNNPTITSNSNVDLFSQAKTQISENTGWATFESSPVKPASQTDDFGSKIEKFAPLTDLFPADFNDAKLSSNDNTTNDSQAWNAFEDLSVEEPFAATTNISQDWFSFEDTNLNEKSTQPNTVVDTSANNPFACDELSEVSNEDWTQKLSMDNLSLLNCGNPFDSLTLTLAESNSSREDKTSSSNNNPFDLPFDPHSEALDMSMEMGPLEKTLPDFQIPDAFLDALFPSQAPSSPFRNIVPPTAITSGSGNPFA